MSQQVGKSQTLKVIECNRTKISNINLKTRNLQQHKRQRDEEQRGKGKNGKETRKNNRIKETATKIWTKSVNRGLITVELDVCLLRAKSIRSLLRIPPISPADTSHLLLRIPPIFCSGYLPFSAPEPPDFVRRSPPIAAYCN